MESKFSEARSDFVKTFEKIQWEYWAISDNYKPLLVEMPTDKVGTFDLNNLVGDHMIYSSSLSLYRMYMEVIWFFVNAFATDNIVEKMPDSLERNFFKFNQRNYFAKHCIPQAFRFLDHLAYHFYKIGHGKILRHDIPEHLIDFRKLRRNDALIDGPIPNLTAKNMAEILNLPVQNLTTNAYRLLIWLRNTYTHRFDIGYDTLTSYILKTSELPPIPLPGRAISVGGKKGHHFFAAPIIKFAQIRPVMQIMFENLIATMRLLAEKQLIRSNDA